MANSSAFSAVSAALGPSKRRGDSERYSFVLFDGGVPMAFMEADGTAATTDTDALSNTFMYKEIPFQLQRELTFAGATGVPFLPHAAGRGLTVQLDAADNDGMFISHPYCTDNAGSTLLTAGRGIYTGRTDGFFVRVKLSIATVASADEVAVGVRKVMLFNTTGITETLNTDLAVLNVDNGTIKIISTINDAAVSTVSTTQTVADTVQVTLEVRVSESGYVRFFVNGVKPTVDVENFRFDSGDALMVFVSTVNDAAGNAGVTLYEWEDGLLTERGLDGVNDLTL